MCKRIRVMVLIGYTYNEPMRMFKIGIEVLRYPYLDLIAVGWK
jgi:hypothetical protein